MVRRALFSLAALALLGVAPAQIVPGASWNLTSPRSAPTVEWSPNGSYIALSTNSAVEVLDGKTLKLKWSRQTAGALPTFMSVYNHPDRAHFATDSKSVWIRTAANGTYAQIDVATGDVIRSHTFSDWDGDYVLTPQASVLTAVKITVSGSDVTLKFRSYDPTTLDPVMSGSYTHTYVAGVDFPVGRFGQSDSIGFYNKLINVSTGVVKSFDTAGVEVWSVAMDPDNHVLQTVMSVAGSTYTKQATRNLKAANTVLWSNTLDLPSTVSFVKSSTGLTLGLAANGVQAQGFDYNTGDALYTSNLGLSGGSSFSYFGRSLNPRDGRLLTAVSAFPAADKMSVYTADGSGVTFTADPQLPISGVASVDSAGTSVLVRGNNGYLGALDSTSGASVWMTGKTNVMYGLTASPSGAVAAMVYEDHIELINTDSGSPAGDYAGEYSSVLWIGDTQLLGIKPDGSADVLNFNAGVVSFQSSLPVAFSGGAAVTQNKRYAVGWAGGKIHVVNLSTLKDVATAYSGYSAYFRMVALNDGTIALLEPASGGLQWGIYTISAAKLVLSSTVPYTSPYTVGTAASVAGDISTRAASATAAFFVSGGYGLDGTPTSQLKVVRVSDGLTLATYDGNFSYVNQLRFAKDGSALYVSTGGTYDISVEDSGPQDLYSLPIPSWLSSVVSASPTVASGGSGSVTVKLVNPAPLGGTIVNLSASPSDTTLPASVKVLQGKSSQLAKFDVPAVATDTVYTVSASVAGIPDVVTTTFTVLAPVPASVTFNNNTVVAGNTVTGTVTLTGVAPTGGTTVTLTSSGASVPATVVVPAGSKSTTFTVTTAASGSASTATVSAKVNSTTVTSGNLSLTATPVSSVTLSPTSVTAGASSTATVTIGGNAGPSGLVVNTSATGATVGSTVTIPAGTNTTTFTVNTAAAVAGSSATVTATLGSSSKSATLTITPTLVSSFTLNNSPVTGGTAVTGTITIGAPAPAGGLVVNLSNNKPSNITVPATVTVAAGQTSVNVSFPTNPTLSAVTATVVASISSSSKTVNPVINPPKVLSVAFVTNPVTGGSSVNYTITLTGPAPAGFGVTVSSNSARLVVTSPAKFTTGQTSQTFTATTTAGAAATATLTASANGGTATADLTINP